MNLEEIKKKISELIKEYTEQAVDRNDMESLELMESMFRSFVSRIEMYQDDVSNRKTFLRGVLIKYLVISLVENGHIIYETDINEQELSFSILTDLPWEDETIEEIVDELESIDDHDLRLAMSLFDAPRLYQGGDGVYFKATSS